MEWKDRMLRQNEFQLLLGRLSFGPDFTTLFRELVEEKNQQEIVLEQQF